MRKSLLSRKPRGNVDSTYFPFKGGLNLVDAPMVIPDGMCIGAFNYELLQRNGYRRIDGFERYDGLPSPSDANYWILNYVNEVSTITEGEIVVGADSSAQGEALIDAVVSGAYVNKLSNPEDFSAWSDIGTCVVTTNTDTAPDGNLTADTLTDNDALGLEGRSQTISGLSTTSPWAVSVFIKKDTDQTRFPAIRVQAQTLPSTFENVVVAVNTQTGAFNTSVDPSVTYTANVVSHDANYWRVEITITPSLGQSEVVVALFPAYCSNLATPTPDPTVTGSVVLWGAMLEEAATVGVYTANTANYGFLVLTDVTGTFIDGEDLEVSAVKHSEGSGIATPRGAPDPDDDATYAQDAIETARDKIGPVGGAACAGPVRGVHVYEGDIYAFRNNSTNTFCTMWKATASGWVQVDLGNRISFTAGTAEFLVGETLTGGTSGASATINRVVVTSGTWSGNDAAGYIILGAVTSGPFQAETGTSASGSATLSGAEVAQTIAKDGNYEFRNYNFFGTAGTFRMYGVSGVDYAFEFDGTAYTPIFTGNTNDKPTHLEVNEYHLMLCFEKGSLQNSATGDPMDWTGAGVAEIGTGDELVGLKKDVGSAMAVICRNRTFQLFGKNTTESPWDLKSVSDESGGLEWTVQRIGSTRYLDDRGFTSIEAVDVYGDFKDAIYSQLIEPLVTEEKNNAISSIIHKGKNQLRTFFNDGTGIYATFNGAKLAGFTQVRYVDTTGASVPVRCTANGEDSLGTEVLFFGSDDGYVYQMDKGTSFDGATVDASLILSYSNLKSPSYNKQFKKCTIEAEGSSGTQIEYNVLLDYSTGKAPAGTALQAQLASGGAYWNQAIWNQFSWASEDTTLIEGNIDGVGRNISLQITSSGCYCEPHTLFGITYHYIFRKLVR